MFEHHVVRFNNGKLYLLNFNIYALKQFKINQPNTAHNMFDSKDKVMVLVLKNQ